MDRKNIWNDAAKYGTIMGLCAIFFRVVSMFVPQGGISLLLSFLSLAVFVTLLFIFTRLRATRCGGYTYGQCLTFVLCMMLFSGMLEGAYQIAASHWLFAERYREMLDASFSALAGTGAYTDAMLGDALGMARRLMMSPLYLLLSGVLGSVCSGCIVGLVVAAAVRRNPDPFAGDKEDADPNR